MTEPSLAIDNFFADLKNLTRACVQGNDPRS